MGRLKFNIGLAVIALLALTGCGSSIGGGRVDGSSVAGGPPTTAFSVELKDTSFFAGGSLDGLTVTSNTDSGKLIAEVYLDNAADLKGVFFDLHYDATAMHPVVANSTELLAPADMALHLAILDEPGVVHFGEAMLNPKTHVGFSGSGVVATVEFALGASKPTPTTGKSTSQAPQINLGWWSADTLYWKYANPGDYDLNGEVNVADISQVAIHYQERITLESLRDIRLVDGDGNSEINLADLTVIVLNYGNSQIGGYDLFSCLNEDDLPENNGGANGPGTVAEGNTPFSQMLSEYPEQILPANPPQEIFDLLPDFFGTIPNVSPDRHYWIRPLPGSSDIGPASTASSYEEFITPGLNLANPSFVSNQEHNQLTIYYENTGDADQDSAVLVSDIFGFHKLLLTHFMATGPWPMDSIENVVDGDNNDEINLSDVGHAMWNQNSAVAGYKVFASNDLVDFHFTKTMVADLPFSSALGDPETERLRFELDIAGLNWDYYMAEAYAYSGDAGSQSEIIYVGE